VCGEKEKKDVTGALRKWAPAVDVGRSVGAAAQLLSIHSRRRRRRRTGEDRRRTSTYAAAVVSSRTADNGALRPSPLPLNVARDVNLLQ